MVIRRIGPLSCAKLAGVLYAGIGLIAGAIFSLVALVGGFAAAQESGNAAFAALFFGVGAIVFLPLFYGAMGFVMTLVAAWLYNVAAGFVGGVEIQTQ
jgi:hypothetical protein